MDTEVIVVGAGPTGLTLAGELALRGVRAVVVERQVVPSGQSRGGGVQPRTAEVLAMRGLLAQVEERAIPREVGGGHFAFLPVPLDTTPWRTRLPGGLLVPQDRLEAILAGRLAELGGSVRRGVALTGVEQSADGVVAGLDDGGVLRGRFLVACDGGHSAVRGLVGAPFPGEAGTMAAVTADVELASASETVPTAVGHIAGHVRTGGGYWMLLHPIGDGVHRVVFGAIGGAADRRDDPVTGDEVATALTAVHGPGTRLGAVRWGTRFSDATRLLDDYRHGRVLFAGDSAHIHPPMGGQGVNLGIQDAVNLGWKLAAVLRGGPDLLGTYTAERRPPAERVIALARAQRAITAPTGSGGLDGDRAAVRDVVRELIETPDGNRWIAGLVSGLSLRYDLGDPDPLVGTRLPDLSLLTADGPTSVSALLGPGRGLLIETGGGSGVPVPAGVDRVVATIADSPVGADLAAERVLVRPDGYVGWAGRGGDAGLAAALDRWFGPRAPVPAVSP